MSVGLCTTGPHSRGVLLPPLQTSTEFLAVCSACCQALTVSHRLIMVPYHTEAGICQSHPMVVAASLLHPLVSLRMSLHVLHY